MPLTDVVRYLNARDREQRPFLRSTAPFVATPEGAYGRYANLRLDSHHAPIYNAQTGSLYGHAGVLSVTGEVHNVTLHPDAVFAIPSSNEEFVHLDRLVRTLHALNYLLHPQAQRLLLRVNLRHIESVPAGHGQVFESALRACGLLPESVTLVVNVKGSPGAPLRSALDSYRAHGYQLALNVQGLEASDTDWLKEISPELVLLDSSLIDEPERLHRAVSRLQKHRLQTLIAIDAQPLRRERAARAGVDFVQEPFPQLTAIKPQGQVLAA